MSTGRSTGLAYDDWFSQVPSWDVDDLRHEPPLLPNETIVCAMQEKIFARSFTTPQGGPEDDGINFRDIASHGYLIDTTITNLVAEQNVDNMRFWCNFTDSGGSWHGQQNGAPPWDENSVMLDIDPASAGIAFRPQIGNAFLAEWGREQYDLCNRQIWYLDALSNLILFQDSPDRNGTDITLDSIANNGGSSTLNVSKWRLGGDRWQGNLSLDHLGTVAINFGSNTDNCLPPTHHVENDNSGNAWQSNTDGIGLGRTILDFGFQKEFDVYVFPVPPVFLHNAASTDQYDSPLNGSVDTIGPFIDHTGLGLQNTRWTYVSNLSGAKIGTGSMAVSGNGGFVIRIPQNAVLSDIVHDPIAEIGPEPVFRSLPGILVTRLDLPGGLQFFDSAINPSAGLSLPPVIFPDGPEV